MFNVRKMIDEAIATKIMGWRISDEPYIFTPNEFVYETVDGDQIDSFNPSESIFDAWQVAEKMGIALIPQTTEEGFCWYACDIEQVSYRGDEVAITLLNDSGVSAETAPMAICLAALYSVGVGIGEVIE